MVAILKDGMDGMDEHRMAGTPPPWQPHQWLTPHPYHSWASQVFLPTSSIRIPREPVWNINPFLSFIVSQFCLRQDLDR